MSRWVQHSIAYLRVDELGSTQMHPYCCHSSALLHHRNFNQSFNRSSLSGTCVAVGTEASVRSHETCTALCSVQVLPHLSVLMLSCLPQLQAVHATRWQMRHYDLMTWLPAADAGNAAPSPAGGSPGPEGAGAPGAQRCHGGQESHSSQAGCGWRDCACKRLPCAQPEAGGPIRQGPGPRGLAAQGGRRGL